MKKTWRNNASTVILPILIALIFLIFTFSFYPFREKLQYDTDEGLNLMRSMLVELGHPLYSEVSSDQPPLFTLILALLFRVVGFEVNASRMVVLLFSTILVWAGAQFLQLTWGKLAAILFLPLIVLTPRYLDLSVSVMIGIPSIALAMVAMLFVALWHRKKNNVWLVLSGFMLAISVLIKFFTGFLAPLFLTGITIAAYLDADKKFSWRVFRPALIWSVCFAGLAALLVLILVGPRNLWLIIYPHMMAPSNEYLQFQSYDMNALLQVAVPILILGFLGAFITIYKRNWLGLYPVAWAAAAYVLFNTYTPVWYHHQLMITIPVALLAAAAIGESIHSLARVRAFSDLVRPQSLLGAGILIVFIWTAVYYAPTLDRQLMDKPRIYDFNIRATRGKLKILQARNDYEDQTTWILTDMPIYAFRVQRPVPPNLATFSEKRLFTGSLTEEDIMSAMRDYRPEQVMIARFNIPVLEEYVQENYTLVEAEEFFRLYIRNDLKPVTTTQ